MVHSPFLSDSSAPPPYSELSLSVFLVLLCYLLLFRYRQRDLASTHMIFGFHSYDLTLALLPASIRVFLNAGSFFANLPAVSGVSSTLAHKIIYRVMASVRSDYTAHVIFKVQKSFFEYPFTYYSLETPKCCSLQKNPLTNKA